MQNVGCSLKDLKGILGNRKFSINYYQRGYCWQEQQINDLITDLTSEFLSNGEIKDRVTAQYSNYFMGSIVLCDEHGNFSIIDGQQRLTSLTLLLIFLQQTFKTYQETYPDLHISSSFLDQISSMIMTENRGVQSFNLNVLERKECMTAIYQQQSDGFNDTTSESNNNLIQAYQFIKENFPLSQIQGEQLLCFYDWLSGYVQFIEITTSSEDDAFRIFLTMNDRGLSLTPREMLKGYLLAGAGSNDSKLKNKLEQEWNECSHKLRQDEQDEDSFIKSWLRGQYAGAVGSTNAMHDFDGIGKNFFRWVQDHESQLGLTNAQGFKAFIDHFKFFVDVNHLIHQAATVFKEETKYVYFNAQLDFTLQTMFLMATINYRDSRSVILEKLNLAARFLDVFIAGRLIMASTITYNTTISNVFKFAQALRNLDVAGLKQQLNSKFDELEFNSDNLWRFTLNKRNSKRVRYFLARINSFVDEQSQSQSNFATLMDSTKTNIEHVLCNHFEQFKDQFKDEKEFDWVRNYMGNLLLLPDSVNKSLGDRPYAEKLKTYCSSSGNLMSASLGSQAYEHNPQFLKFIKDNQLNFKSYSTFGHKEIDERINLLIQLCSLVWNNDMFKA